METQIKLTVRPNNQIVLTTGRWRKKEILVSQHPQNDFDKISYLDARDLAYDYEAARVVLPKIRGTLQSARSANLDLIQKSQRSQKYPSLRLNRAKSFTKHSGQKLRECGAAMAIAANGEHGRCREVTLTLPANTKEAFTALAAYSGYAINRLLQPVRREWGRSALWFFVWEYQKRGALHLHFALFHEDKNECEKMAHRMIEQWHKVLICIGELADTCMFSRRNKRSCTIRKNHQYHTAAMEKEVSRYFAKYAGKEESKNSWYCRKYPVSRFWGCSYSLKDIIKKHSFECEWDYFGNQKEADKMIEEIAEKVIEKLNIVSSSAYDFAIWIKGKIKQNLVKNKIVHYKRDRDKCISSGTRRTFYFESKDIEKALSLAETMRNVF